MVKNIVAKLAGRDTITDPFTKLLRTGAEQLIYQAVEVELLKRWLEHSDRRTEDGTAGSAQRKRSFQGVLPTTLSLSYR